MPMVRMHGIPNKIQSNLIVWTQLTVYVPQVSHNEVEGNGGQPNFLLISEPLNSLLPLK